MGRVYVSGPMHTRTFTVEQAGGIGLGLLVAPVTKDTSGMTVGIAGANASNVIGVAYAADFTGKYASISTVGSGVGTAKTQNTAANGQRLTVLMKGSGAVVDCYTSTTNISAGISVKAAAGGSIAATAGDETPNQYVGTTLTAQATASGTIQVLLNF